MARHMAWFVALVLLAPAAGRAEAACDHGLVELWQAPQQRGGPPQGAHQGDKDKPQGRGDDRGPAKWWIDAKLRAELAITDQQSAAVESIWQKSAPPQMARREQLNKLEEELSKMTDVAEEAAVIAQIDRVETLRGEMNRARTLMIYRMNRILTPDQRAKVKAMYERRDPPRRGSSK